MWTDPIVDEVRKNREEYAAQFNFDLRAMVRDLQERERASGRKLVSFPQKPCLEEAPCDKPPIDVPFD